MPAASPALNARTVASESAISSWVFGVTCCQIFRGVYMVSSLLRGCAGWYYHVTTAPGRMYGRLCYNKCHQKCHLYRFQQRLQSACAGERGDRQRPDIRGLAATAAPGARPDPRGTCGAGGLFGLRAAEV